MPNNYYEKDSKPPINVFKFYPLNGNGYFIIDNILLCFP